MRKSICCIFNLAPHYNAPIYNLMDKELSCDFYLGDRIATSMELMKYESLKGFKKRLKFIRLLGNFYWQSGAISLAFKPYQHYIITGEPFCISSWFILIFNKLTGRKTYLWTHGWYGSEKGVKKIIKKFFFSLSYKIFLYGDYAKKLMIEEGFKSKKLVTVYNSLDFDNQIIIQQKLKPTSIYQQHFNNNKPVLLYIGRIQLRKKIELVIEALHTLNKNNILCNLILIGKQTDETTISELINKYGLAQNVWFFGPCYNENVIGELIYNADVCVSPGNVGLTAMHSLIYGTPVITQNNFTTQMPEFEAIEIGITGDFFKEDMVEDLVAAILKWINIDLKQRSITRERAYSIMNEKYNPHNQIKIIKQALI